MLSNPKFSRESPKLDREEKYFHVYLIFCLGFGWCLKLYCKSCYAIISIGPKYFQILKFLVSFYAKINTKLTNITFIFDQIHPRRRKVGGIFLLFLFRVVKILIDFLPIFCLNFRLF